MEDAPYLDRTLEENIPELMDYLRPGITVLDVGCGPGNLTLDVGRVISPGKVIGLDYQESSIQYATDLSTTEPTVTATATATPTPTSTATPTATPTPTSTATPTFTPTPTPPPVTTINVTWLSIQPGTIVVPDETVIEVRINYSFSQPDSLAAIVVDTVLFESPDCTTGGPWDVQPRLADQNGGIKTGQSSGTLDVPKSISSSTIKRGPTNVKAVSFLVRLYQEDVDVVRAEDADYAARCYPLP